MTTTANFDLKRARNLSKKTNTLELAEVEDRKETPIVDEGQKQIVQGYLENLERSHLPNITK